MNTLFKQAQKDAYYVFTEGELVHELTSKDAHNLMSTLDSQREPYTVELLTLADLITEGDIVRPLPSANGYSANETYRISLQTDFMQRNSIVLITCTDSTIEISRGFFNHNFKIEK